MCWSLWDLNLCGCYWFSFLFLFHSVPFSFEWKFHSKTVSKYNHRLQKFSKKTFCFINIYRSICRLSRRWITYTHAQTTTPSVLNHLMLNRVLCITIIHSVDLFCCCCCSSLLFSWNVEHSVPWRAAMLQRVTRWWWVSRSECKHSYCCARARCYCYCCYFCYVWNALYCVLYFRCRALIAKCDAAADDEDDTHFVRQKTTNGDMTGFVE